MRRKVYLVGAAVAVIAASLVIHSFSDEEAFDGPACTATANEIKVGLDLEQATHATTIVAVGKKLGVPDHGVTIALATAYQESDIRNIEYGDRDSLGLFQQRPSQGWGTEKQILSPRYAATSFYTRLIKVAGWNDMSVTDAAQAVQRSAAPTAYAQWESQARVIAQALTGQVAAGFACRVPVHTSEFASSLVAKDLTSELGSNDVGKEVSNARGHIVASWLIGHAQQYGVRTVDFAGKRWTNETGEWRDYGNRRSVVEVNA